MSPATTRLAPGSSRFSITSRSFSNTPKLLPLFYRNTPSPIRIPCFTSLNRKGMKISSIMMSMKNFEISELSVWRNCSVSPWKKILHIIGAFLPLGLLLALLSPRVINADPNAYVFFLLFKKFLLSISWEIIMMQAYLWANHKNSCLLLCSSVKFSICGLNLLPVGKIGSQYFHILRRGCESASRTICRAARYALSVSFLSKRFPLLSWLIERERLTVEIN